MPGFKTYFPLKGIRTDVSVTPLEDNIFSIELESADPFDEDKNPKSETVASKNSAKLLIQKTGSNWAVLLDELNFNLNGEDLKALGNAIESRRPGRV